jgi:hypothetical protein
MNMCTATTLFSEPLTLKKKSKGTAVQPANMRPKQGLKRILNSTNFLDQDKQHGIYTKKGQKVWISQTNKKKSKKDYHESQ